MRDADPALGQRMLEKAGDALTEAQLWLAELTAGSAPARVRVARLLLRLQTKPGSDEVFRLASSDIAAILGITVETASRVIAAFKRSGVLTPPTAGSHVMKMDFARLSEEAEARGD